MSPTKAGAPQFAAAELGQRIAALRGDLTAARAKERRLRESIRSRESTLNRLQIQLVRQGESGSALGRHGV